MNACGPEKLTEEAAVRKTLAHVLPIGIFLGLMTVVPFLKLTGFVIENEDMYPWYRHAPEHWLYPLQVIVCLFLIRKYWKDYNFAPVKGLGLAALMGIVGILVWVLPGYLFQEMNMEDGWWKIFGFTAREGGFDPSVFGETDTAWYWIVIGLRFVRMVFVVSIIEEVFWRGFLMRYFLDKDGDYWEQPFGKFSWKSYTLVTCLFMFVHVPSDYFAAVVYGSITYWVAVHTKSLAACVVMHAVANLLLGGYVMVTGNFGYW